MTDLSDQDAAFVAAYLETGDAVAACQRVGLGPRDASKTITRLMPVIEAARSARAVLEPETGPTALERAQAAYALAEREGNAAAMVSASQLIARLEGVLDGSGAVEPDATPREPADPRTLLRAIFQILRNSAVASNAGAIDARAFELCAAALAGGRLVVIEPPGKYLVIVSDPEMAAAMGGTLATPLIQGDNHAQS